MTVMDSPFSLLGRIAVVTGGYGVLGGSIASGLAAAGARVAILGRRITPAEAKAEEIRREGGEAFVVEADVLNSAELKRARDKVIGKWGRIDMLINAAGGNVQRSRTDNIPIFDMPLDAFDEVVALNLQGTVIPTLIFGETMAAQKKGAVVTISSMAATQALSGVMGYSMAKAAIDNFTKWMAVDLARRFGDGVRVNAIAPGFFITSQNKAVLIQTDGTYSDRARTIIAKTPMGRFGSAEELNGAVQWLCSDAASFVTGVVLPVDGGFSAFSGV